jgi:hypothetical protein
MCLLVYFIRFEIREKKGKSFSLLENVVVCRSECRNEIPGISTMCICESGCFYSPHSPYTMPHTISYTRAPSFLFRVFFGCLTMVLMVVVVATHFYLCLYVYYVYMYVCACEATVFFLGVFVRTQYE